MARVLCRSESSSPFSFLWRPPSEAGEVLEVRSREEELV
jgi:hypothetical protein